MQLFLFSTKKTKKVHIFFEEPLYLRKIEKKEWICVKKTCVIAFVRLYLLSVYLHSVAEKATCG